MTTPDYLSEIKKDLKSSILSNKFTGYFHFALGLSGTLAALWILISYMTHDAYDIENFDPARLFLTALVQTIALIFFRFYRRFTDKVDAYSRILLKLKFKESALNIATDKDHQEGILSVIKSLSNDNFQIENESNSSFLPFKIISTKSGNMAIGSD